MQLNEKKAMFAWAMYDWANSAFATTVIAGFFPVFFKEFWNIGVDATVSTARLGLANSLAGIFVALMAPILGAIADKGTAKKRFLIAFTYLGLVMTSGLFLAAQGQWLLAMLLYIFASIGFSGANVFYDALLSAVASEEKMDVVSALGYSLGYLGGGLLFALNVWMVQRPQTFGFAGPGDAVRFSFLSAGIWWALFSVPAILFIKEPHVKSMHSTENMVLAGFTQLRQTFQEIRHMKTIFLFLAAYWLYIDGVDTIVRMAVDYGLSLGFDSGELIKALLVTQFVGFPSAIAFGFLGKKIGAKRGIFLAIAVYLFISIWAAFIREKFEFYMLAVLIGLVQGGIQSLSRSYYARIIPASRSAEYFGFYNMLGKFAAVIGPVLMGAVGLLFRSSGSSSDSATRTGMTSLSLLFLAGGMLFYFVDEKKGRQELQYLHE